MSIELRHLTAADAAVLDHVAEDVFDEPVDSDYAMRHLAAPGHRLIVAIDRGLVVGQVSGVLNLHPDKPPDLFIDEVGVAEDWRRRGIARLMLDAMLDWGREQGCHQAWVGTEHDNEAARALYERRAGGGEPFVLYTFKL